MNRISEGLSGIIFSKLQIYHNLIGGKRETVDFCVLFRVVNPDKHLLGDEMLSILAARRFYGFFI